MSRLPLDSSSGVLSILKSLLDFSPNMASMVWCFGGVCFGWSAVLTVVLVHKSTLPAFGVAARKFRLNAFTAARCCLKNISRFAKPAAAVGADISSLLSVSIAEELLASGPPHSRK